MDLRIEKTKNSILNAFIALRAKKPLEKITVKELCEMAMINKSTFYSHYEDIYALSDEVESEVVNSVLQTLKQDGFFYGNTEAFTMALFHGYVSQEHLLHILFSGSRGSQLAYKIERGIKELIFQDYPQCRDDLDVNMALSFIIYGSYFAYMTGQHYDREEVITVLSRISQHAADVLFGTSGILNSPQR